MRGASPLENRMSEELRCFRCGESLTALTPPISRQDQCPSCSIYLHVCRMCVYFDVNVPKQCREDDAEDVTDKEKLNFCDWYQPTSTAFDSGRKREADHARSQLDSLFGEADSTSEPSASDESSAAEDLFK